MNVRGLECRLLFLMASIAERRLLFLQDERSDDAMPLVAGLAVLRVAKRLVDDFLQRLFLDRLMTVHAVFADEAASLAVELGWRSDEKRERECDSNRFREGSHHLADDRSHVFSVHISGRPLTRTRRAGTAEASGSHITGLIRSKLLIFVRLRVTTVTSRCADQPA